MLFVWLYVYVRRCSAGSSESAADGMLLLLQPVSPEQEDGSKAAPGGVEEAVEDIGRAASLPHR